MFGINLVLGKIKKYFDKVKMKITSFLYRVYKKVTRLEFIAISIVVVFVLFLLGVGTYKYVTTPENCLKCHEMKPEYVTWRASNHGDFSCIECHRMENGVLKNVKAISFRIYKHFTGTFTQPIEIEKETKNTICVQCHSANRDITPSGDLEFPHKRHIDKGLNCIECHTGSAHGNLVEKGYTINSKYEQWTVGMGKSYMRGKLTVTPMDKCMSCHKDRGVANECATCHTGIGVPKDHMEKNWKQKHGEKARQDIFSCDKCHSYTNNWVRFNENNTSYGDYARNNRFCSKCHVGMEGLAKDFPTTSKAKNKNASKRGNKITNSKPIAEKPGSHDDNWRQDHGVKAKDSIEGCLVCHDQTKNPKANSTTTYCVKCHKTPHNFPEKHPVSLKGVRLDKSCFKCHSSKKCNACHSIKV